MTGRRARPTYEARTSRAMQFVPGHVGGRVASAQPVQRTGGTLRRPSIGASAAASCSLMGGTIYPTAQNSNAGTISTTGSDPYVNGAGTVTLEDDGTATGGLIRWDLPAATLDEDNTPTSLTVSATGQWIDGTGSEYGGIQLRLYKWTGSAWFVVTLTNDAFGYDAGTTVLTEASVTVDMAPNTGFGWDLDAVVAALNAQELVLVAYQDNNVQLGDMYDFTLSAISITVDYC